MSTPNHASASLLVALQGIDVTYAGQSVLRQLNFEVSAGRNVWLTGPSGAGKTTLLRLIAGLDAPDSGTVSIEGRLCSTTGTLVVPPHQRGLALVFQDLGLWPNLTAIGNVLLGLSGLRLSRADRRARAQSALEACGLTRLADRTPARLSGGEQQRVALARALAVEPRLLLLDEPFTGLDLVTRQALLDQLAHLCAERRVTVILASHQAADAAELHAETAVLEDGLIADRGELELLLTTPRSRTLAEIKRRLQRPELKTAD